MALTLRLYVCMFLFFVLVAIGMLKVNNYVYRHDLNRVENVDIQFPEGLRRISQRLEVAEISLNESEPTAEMIYEQ